MRERAKTQDETRSRIVEAAMHLHEEVGPRATTISGVAERAGVQRLTVYRHFPDETTLFQACTAHWLTLHPPPDERLWQAIADSGKRIRTALAAFYDYYQATERMWAASHRDVADVPALQGPMAEFESFVDGVGDDLVQRVKGGAKQQRMIAATIRHGLEFTTWADLEKRGLDNAEKVALVEFWLKKS